MSAAQGVCPSGKRLDDVELADRGPLATAALVKPLPVGGDGEDGAVLAAAPVRLQGDLRLPVLEAQRAARLVHPVALRHHVVDSQPDVLVEADAAADVVIQLVVLLAAQRGTQGPALSDAVIASGVVRLLHWICQETLTKDLGAFQAN